MKKMKTEKLEQHFPAGELGTGWPALHSPRQTPSADSATWQRRAEKAEAEVERLRAENANYDRHAQEKANEHARELERLRLFRAAFEENRSAIRSGRGQ